MDTTNYQAPFDSRLGFAAEQLHMTFLRRDHFLSDSDLMDAADDWTTSERGADGMLVDEADWGRLINALHDIIDRGPEWYVI